MKLTELHVGKEGSTYLLEAYYEGRVGNVEATRVYTWKFLSVEELLKKEEELLREEHN